MPLSYRKRILIKCSLKLKNKGVLNNINLSRQDNLHQKENNNLKPVIRKILIKTFNKINKA